MSVPPHEPAVVRAGQSTVAACCRVAVEELVGAGFELSSVYLLIGNRLRCYAARGYHQVVDGFPPGAGVIGEVVARGASVLLPDVRKHPDFIAAVPGIRAEAGVPVVVRGAVTGAVNVESRSTLPPDTLTQLERVAARLAADIVDAGGPPQPSLSQRLAQFTVELTGTTEAGHVEQRAVQAAIDLTGMSSAAIVHTAPRRPQVSTAHGPLAEALRAWRRSEIDIVTGWVRAGTSSHFPGGSDDIPVEYLFLRAAGICGLTVHPLVSRGAPSGLLIVADGSPVEHATEVVECLELLAAQTASQLAVAALVDELGRKAQLDGLTGLRNATSFATDLAARADAEAPGTLLLLDIDHFKRVNDTRGHLAGDALLRDLAARLSQTVRDGERLYRIGGDELAVLTDSDGQAAVEALAERLLQVAREGGITLSVGTSRVLRGRPEQTRSAADIALYRAKAAGRDAARHSTSEVDSVAGRASAAEGEGFEPSRSLHP